MKDLTKMLREVWHNAKTVQWRESVLDKWIDISKDLVIPSIIDCMENDWELRIKPKTVTLPAREIPIAETVAPSKGTLYYVPNFFNTRFYQHYHLTKYNVDRMLLERNVVFLNPKDAELAAKAMFHSPEKVN
jgi:hypothetical protein